MPLRRQPVGCKGRNDPLFFRMPGHARKPGFLVSLFRRVDLALVVLAAALAFVLHQRYAAPDAGFSWQGEVAETQAMPPAAPAVEGEKDMPRTGAPVRFLMQNVQNYFVAGERSRSRYVTRPKSALSREAVADVIASARPDIVGLVEIGGPEALKDLASRLEKRGLSYPWQRVVARMGEDRALALLSRHPIVQDHSQTDYGLFGQQKRKMLRGILDVTVHLPDGRYFRIMGAHLKSRVADDAMAATSLRTREAQTLALHIQEAMRRQPSMPLLVFGDWNDGPNDASLAVLRHGISDDAALSRIQAEDASGQNWTLYYKSAQEYLMFDQIYVNAALRKRMGRSYASGIVDIPASRKASDHRAVWCDLR